MQTELNWSVSKNGGNFLFACLLFIVPHVGTSKANEPF